MATNGTTQAISPQNTIFVPAPTDNGFDYTYIFTVTYAVMRKGKKGLIPNKFTTTMASPYFNGRNLPRMIKEKHGDNTIVESIIFKEQYNVQQEAIRLNSGC